MDIPRKSAARKRNIKRAVYIVLVVIAGLGVTAWLRKLQPAAPSVDAGTVWPGTVKQGEMVRNVRGLGTLVAEDIHWIPAVTLGKIDKILLRPGAEVKVDTVIIEMSNPDLQQSALDAELAVKAAEASYTDLKVQLEKGLLDQKANAAKAQSDYAGAKMTADTNNILAKQGLIGDLVAKLSQITADDLSNRAKIEQQRLAISDGSIQAQLAVQRSRIDQAQEVYKLRRSQLDALKVRAGTNGTLTVIAVEEGQQVAQGANLARVADPTKLKAELKIAETSAKDVMLGQLASIDTHNGLIKGRVSRKDPAAVNGTFTVDCSLEGELPKGAQPDLTVEGTIEFEKLTNVLYVERPVHGQENSLVSLFKYDEDGKGATRVQVKLGRSSVNYIEVLDGLKVGDKVILSDTSAWDNNDRIRLN
jgi:HlyD family secretion protein